jgi:Nif-specific regulatory protein
MSRETDTTPESELLVLQQAARLIARSADPKPAIQGILRLLSELLGLNRGRVLLPDEESGALAIEYAYGLSVAERERGSYSVGEGVTGRVFQTGQLALVPDIDDEPAYLARAVDRTTLPNEAVAYMAVPIILDEHPIGVLAVHRLRKRERAFQRDLALLQVVATLIGQVLQVKALVEERTAQLESENRLLRNRIVSDGAPYGILGESPALQQAVQQALQVAKTDTTVLLLGESGTGKERFARMQHLAGNRSAGPFVSVNCAAIPATLIESELFGHEKGAFTGATATKKGKIELADGGTLFLDEIGDLELELQAKLLKVLESRSIQRVGSARDIPVDVRIVAATHKNLQEAVNANRFRLDLFYRLNVFPIRLPPLRARRGDVAVLAQYFLKAANDEYGKAVAFGIGSVELLEQYPWPGNIRQLENLVKRAVLLTPGPGIGRKLIESILSEEGGVASPPPTVPVAAPDRRETRAGVRIPGGAIGEGMRPYARVREEEIEQILEALRQQGGNKTRAAISLGLTPRQLRYRMLKLNLDG